MNWLVFNLADLFNICAMGTGRKNNQRFDTSYKCLYF